MERYSNRRGNSPITYFQIENDRIIVKFKDGKSYAYSHFKAGSHHVEQMKNFLNFKSYCSLTKKIGLQTL